MPTPWAPLTSLPRATPREDPSLRQMPSLRQSLTRHPLTVNVSVPATVIDSCQPPVPARCTLHSSMVTRALDHTPIPDDVVSAVAQRRITMSAASRTMIPALSR